MDIEIIKKGMNDPREIGRRGTERKKERERRGRRRRRGLEKN